MAKVNIIKGTASPEKGKEPTRRKKLRVAAYCRVSTDNEDQLASYDSQIKYYTERIGSQKEWKLAGIYADEGITGTIAYKRDRFLRMIQDCEAGKIDMIITKSVSRFARNTLDVLKYVRSLKEMNIAVFFEEENINTLSMDGEMLLSVLSAVYQQEVENISANVKKGLRMKMSRGELIGRAACLGYDYDTKTKTLTVNEEEAKTVRYIFKRYIEGAGSSRIRRELEAKGMKTKRGRTSWQTTTIIGILNNEKYIGNILQGKTYIVNPITKQRVNNHGEQDQFHIERNHPAIISPETFQKAQDVRKRRAASSLGTPAGEVPRFGKRYAFSHMIQCAYCGSKYVRHVWNSCNDSRKAVWQCGNAIAGGKRACPHSKGIEDSILKEAFVESFNRINSPENRGSLKEFLQANKSEASSLATGEKGLICSSVNSKPSNKYSQHGVNMK